VAVVEPIYDAAGNVLRDPNGNVQYGPFARPPRDADGWGYLLDAALNPVYVPDTVPVFDVTELGTVHYPLAVRHTYLETGANFTVRAQASDEDGTYAA